MKAVSTILAALFLAGCGTYDMSGRGGAGDMGRSGYSNQTDFTRGFDPNNPYHGG